MNQLSFFEPEPRTLARRSDPSTSHAAAARVQEFSGSHRAQVLEALKRYGPLTVDQIATRTKLQSQQVNKRTFEMQRLGLIDVTGEERLSASGRLERVWKAN